MSPDQDIDQQHPSVAQRHLTTNIDIVDMPAVSRGWNPIAQSDDLLHTLNETTPIATATANNANNSTPKKTTVVAPTANGNSASSTATASPSTTPTKTTATIMPSNGVNGASAAVAFQNGNSQNGVAVPKGNGIGSSNGNGSAAAYALLPSPAHSNGHSVVVVDAPAKTANNNDVFATSSPSRVEKNGWKELPQDEQDANTNIGGGTATTNGTPNGGGGGGPTMNGNGNGNSIAIANEKLQHSSNTAEDDPLTGVICKDIDPDELSTCGIGACQPKWARMFASTKSFMFVFLVAWVLQGMYFTYVVSVITTIEKLFQIKSKTSGMLLSATEIGQICTALLLTYFAGQGHRPRWIACSMVLFAVCAFGCSLPHFLYGSELLHANNALYGGRSVATVGMQMVVTDSVAAVASGPVGPYSDSLRESAALVDDTAAKVLPLISGAQLAFNRSVAPQSVEYNLCRTGGNGTSSFDGACQLDEKEQQAQHSQITYTVLLMLVICMLGVGVGQTAVATLGIPFIDDNVASRESAIYIAITIGVRILGPTSGFMLGSVCTRLHVDLLDPGYGPEDPKWVGAWYLGLVIIPTLMFFAALAMFTFPKHLKGHRIPPPVKLRAIESAKKLEKQQQLDQDRPTDKPRLRDFPKTIRRQLSNDILMFRTASSVLHLLPVAGLYTFLPKFLESQFQMAAHESSMITGTYGILVMGVGIVISGVVILKCSPTARSVAAYIAFTAIVYSAGMAALMFLGCSMDDFVGLKTTTSTMPAHMDHLLGESRFVPPCNVSCDCDYSTFAPICGSDGKTYFSSCHAGCTAAVSPPGGVGKMHFKDCECIPENLDAQFEAINGHCDSQCQSYIAFIALFSFLVFMHSTSEVGSMLLIMRCTDPKDKAMAMGIIQFAIGLFGNVPCPIIYGAVIDSTCLVWDTICGKQGACKQYDKDAFRHFFFGTTSGIMFLAFIMDLVVWHKAHRIDIDPENNASTSSASGGSATDSEADAEKPAGSTVVAVTTIVPDSSV